MGAGLAFSVIATLFANLGIAATISRRRPPVTRRALPLSPRQHRVPRVAGRPHFPQSREVSRRAMPAATFIHRGLLIDRAGE